MYIAFEYYRQECLLTFHHWFRSSIVASPRNRWFSDLFRKCKHANIICAFWEGCNKTCYIVEWLEKEHSIFVIYAYIIISVFEISSTTSTTLHLDARLNQAKTDVGQDGRLCTQVDKSCWVDAECCSGRWAKLEKSRHYYIWTFVATWSFVKSCECWIHGNI